MKISVSKYDAVWGYLSTAFSMCINFIMLPFILYFLSIDEVGVYYIFTSLSAVGTFFDFGFSPCFARSISYAWSGAKSIDSEGGSYSISNNPNYELLKKIIKTCKILYFFIAAFALVLALTFGSIYIYKLVEKLDNPGRYLVSWYVYALSIFLSLLYGYYTAFLSGIGAVRYANKAMVIGRVIQIIVCIFLLFCGLNILGVAIAYFCYGFSFRFIAKHYFDSYNNMKRTLKKITIKVTRKDITELLVKIWPNTWKEGIVTLSNYIANQGTTIICSCFFSLYETGLYSLTNQLVQAVVSIASAMYNTFMPTLQSAYSNNDRESQRNSLSAVVISYVLIFSFGMISLLIFGRPIVSFMSSEYHLDLVLLLGIGFYQFILKYRNCYCTYFSSTNRIIYYKSYFISAIGSIVLSIIILSIVNIGIWGMLMPHILVQIIYNFWYWAFKAHKELDLTSRDILSRGLIEIKRLIQG